jgi:hypothetical protein
MRQERMTPGEIRACYRRYAAHRMSHEICAFPGTISIINSPGDPDELGVLLRLHIGLVREIGQLARLQYRLASTT